MYNTALKYAKKGWCLLPVGYKTKVPKLTNWTFEASNDPQKIKEWFDGKTANIGVATGKKSGFWVLDVDGQEGIQEYFNLVMESGEDAPNTICQKTGGGGYQYFFEYDERISKNSVRKLPHIDIRADGGQVLVPPSIHPNGTAYKWEVREGVKLEKAPEWLIEKLIADKEHTKIDLREVKTIAEGGRNDTLFKIACRYRNDGLTQNELEALMQEVNSRCDNPLDKDEVCQIVKSALVFEPKQDIVEQHYQEPTLSDIMKRPLERANQYFTQSVERRGILGYKLCEKFQSLQKRMDGIQKGMYLLGAISNVGKTSLLLNLARSLVKSNDNLHVIYFSIDDNFRKVYNRLLAIESGLTINVCGNIGQSIIDNKDMTAKDRVNNADRVEEAKEKVDRLLERFTLLDETDGNSITVIRKITEEMAEHKKDLVIIVDNFHKIRSDKNYADGKQKFTYLSEEMKALTNRHDIVTIMTVELRKLNHDNAPTPDDLKETVDLHYDSDVVWMLHSEHERNKSSEKVVVEGYKSYPIVDLSIPKNKNSDFKGSIELVLKPEYADYQEVEYYKKGSTFAGNPYKGEDIFNDKPS